VIDVDGEATYCTARQRDPDRLVVDVLGTQPSAHLKKPPLAAHDPLLCGVRAAQHQPHVVRVVLELTARHDYRVFAVSHPYCLMIDIQGEAEQNRSPPHEERTRPLTPPVQSEAPSRPTRPAALPGPRWRVTLTREADVFLPLEERTAIANTQGADLFVSIHANAAEHPEAYQEPWLGGVPVMDSLSFTFLI
jgi:N-acetylmuramoyl-L-alanine amidase